MNIKAVTPNIVSGLFVSASVLMLWCGDPPPLVGTGRKLGTGF